MSSYLHDSIISSAPRIGQYTNKNELYRQLPLRRVKGTNINEIESYSCARNFRIVTQVLNIEREQ